MYRLLPLLIERVERLEEEKRDTQDDIKDFYGAAKATGFDVRTIRAIPRAEQLAIAEPMMERAVFGTWQRLRFDELLPHVLKPVIGKATSVRRSMRKRGKVQGSSAKRRAAQPPARRRSPRRSAYGRPPSL